MEKTVDLVHHYSDGIVDVENRHDKVYWLAGRVDQHRQFDGQFDGVCVCVCYNLRPRGSYDAGRQAHGTRGREDAGARTKESQGQTGPVCAFDGSSTSVCVLKQPSLERNR